MEYAIARVFEKRVTEKSSWGGRIGSVEGTADVGNVVLNGKTLPQASVDYLLHFSLQSLQDAYAGADDLAEATALFDKKLAALLEGTIGVRSGGSGMTDEQRAEIYVAEQAIRAKIGNDAWKALDDEARVERAIAGVTKLRDKDPETFAARVAERVAHVVEQRAKKAAEKAALKGLGADVDL